MTKPIEVVFRNGVLEPLQPLKLQEGTRLRILMLQPGRLTARPPTAEQEQMLRDLGFGAFADIPDEEWEKIAQGWKWD